MRSQIWPQVIIYCTNTCYPRPIKVQECLLCSGCGVSSGSRSLLLVLLFLVLLVLALFVLLILCLGLCDFGGSRGSLLDLERAFCQVRSTISTLFEFNVALEFIRVTSSQAGTQIGSTHQWKHYEKRTQAGRGQLVNPSTTEVW